MKAKVQKNSTTKDIIIKTAKKLFWEKGYEATSPRDIQIESEVGQGSFYHHFKSKLELGHSVLDDLKNDFNNDLEKIFAKEKDPAERIRDYLLRPRMAVKGCKLGRFVYETEIHNDYFRKPITEYFANLENKIAEALSEINISRKLGKTETELSNIAKMVVSVIQGGFLLSRAKNKNEMDNAIKGLISLLDTFIKN